MDEDECWFSRFAQPQTKAWALAHHPLKLVQREPRSGETTQALACFGAVRQDTGQVLLSLSQGQPNSVQMWLFIMGLLVIAGRKGPPPVPEGRTASACLPHGERAPALEVQMHRSSERRGWRLAKYPRD